MSKIKKASLYQLLVFPTKDFLSLEWLLPLFCQLIWKNIQQYKYQHGNSGYQDAFSKHRVTTTQGSDLTKSGIRYQQGVKQNNHRLISSMDSYLIAKKLAAHGLGSQTIILQPIDQNQGSQNSPNIHLQPYTTAIFPWTQPKHNSSNARQNDCNNYLYMPSINKK